VSTDDKRAELASWIETLDGERQLAAQKAVVMSEAAGGDSLDSYQFEATRTLPEERALEDNLLMTALGLSGESGEVADLIKKHCYHGHDLDVSHVVRELGDVLWYLACMADVLGVSLSHVAAVNIDKLKTRYPDGFSEERSRER
jgi:NTP pyrophosphatase (non-canonical NTP hydrolase)